MIIAIDGPSGTGKSTVAQKTASALDFLFFDTGAMYRSFAYFLTRKHCSFNDPQGIRECLKSFDFDIDKGQDGYRYLLDGEDISEAIRQEKISELASTIAGDARVRAALLPLQRAFGRKGDLVMEGRDIGTAVFPDAELKIFLTAEEEIRAKRRFLQLKEKFPLVSHSYENVLKEIQNRDANDTNRTVAPLRQAKDAVLIDTSHLSIEQVVEQIVNLTKKVK